MGDNSNLRRAMAEKNDEFYTRIEDISEEIGHYPDAFRGKSVYCNCDLPSRSMFVRYFRDRFSDLGLRRLVATGYVPGGHGEALEVDAGGERSFLLEGDGDFRSLECLGYLGECDEVVTNPPFSLFREYLDLAVGSGKKFLIVGNKNSLTFKEVFSHLMADRLWVGYTPMGRGMLFDVPPEVAEAMVRDGKEGWQYRRSGGKVYGRAAACWITNMPHGKRNTPLELTREYSGEAYPAYDNYDAVEVGKVTDIPRDYPGVMGVPITFLDKYCPAQFEILGMDEAHGRGHSRGRWSGSGSRKACVGGKEMYARIFIRRRQG